MNPAGLPQSPIPGGRTPEVSPSVLCREEVLSPLRQHPPEEPGADAADRLLLDTAAAWWAAGHPRDVVAVADDRWGALAAALLAAPDRLRPGDLRLGQDARVGELAAGANAARLGLTDRLNGLTRTPGVTAELVAGARTVLMPLPRSLDTLRDWAWLVAEHAAEDVVLLAGGRDKHMSRSMNAVLGEHFSDVVPGRGRSKARVLTARGPRRDVPRPFPRAETHSDLPGLEPGSGLTLYAQGAVYGGTSLDPGTRFLLETLPAQDLTPDGVPEGLVDLGCGNGTIAVWAALRHPSLRVVAVDQSASAVESTRLTAQGAGVADRVQTIQDDGLSRWEDGSASMILLNPPFHRGNVVDPTAAHHLIAEAGRALRPGGRLFCVWNSHLRHRPVLERSVGPTRQVARNPKFTVTASTRRA